MYVHFKGHLISTAIDLVRPRIFMYNGDRERIPYSLFNSYKQQHITVSVRVYIFIKRY